MRDLDETPKRIAGFDSATAILRAPARFRRTTPWLRVRRAA
ncbi:MAG: hypothetical protein ACRD29_21810 [Acidimicrobiales bacterium]